MSEQYPGGFITRLEPTVNGSVARGMWTLSQAAGYRKQGLWPTVPGAPTIGTATAGTSANASVTFTAPSNIGSAAITSYTVTSSPGGFTGTGASSPVTVSGLTVGTSYTFTVTATNGAGTGPSSAASNSITAAQVNYIENVFSTWLYNGNSSAQTITNGINLSANGGMVWAKARSGGAAALEYHHLFDTARGPTNALYSNLTDAQASSASYLSSFNSDGFTIAAGNGFNTTGTAEVSWTFREQPKFFDIVTYTGNGVSGRTISHNLGSTPGFILVKCTSSAAIWAGYHRSLGATQLIRLNTTDAATTNSTIWNNTEPTSSVFSVGNAQGTNQNTSTYVAYLFAHDAGGFGLSGNDNVVSCGTYTGAGADLNINLGYEPQFVIIKCTTNAVNWVMFDNMRGWPVSGDAKDLRPNLTDAEGDNPAIGITSTGFLARNGIDGQINASGRSYIYVAIRRGPMAVPTTSASVFDAGTRSGSGSVAKTNSNVLTDLTFIKNRTSGGEYWAWTPRLNSNLTLQSNSTDANLTGAMTATPWDTMTGAFCAASNGATNSGSLIDYSFRRAPGFFDVVCYTGNGGYLAIPHNLTTTPGLIIIKRRDAAGAWGVWAANIGTGSDGAILLNSSAAKYGAGVAFSANSTQFAVFNSDFPMSNSINGATYVSYLFATCSGVSKVGTYTGTGTTQTINCGFTAGSRFVLIKRTDSTGDWYVWDSARGIVAGNDPYLLLNSTAAEVTNTDFVDTAATGFEISSTAPAAINASGGTYIFLAIA